MDSVLPNNSINQMLVARNKSIVKGKITRKNKISTRMFKVQNKYLSDIESIILKS